MTGAPQADQTFLAVQGALAGEYSLEREIGRGGMGIVYLAREVRLAREVALKVLLPELGRSEEMRGQFLREAQMAAGLSHPNIVPIFRVGEVGEIVYFAMAYVPGVTLAEQVRNHGPLAPHRAARVLRDVGWALTYSHASGVVHRDIKADNILIEQGTGRTLVTDFGIAGAARLDARSGDGRVMGSAHYVSPEQAAGEPMDERSDLYSLGVLGYLALAGRLPLDGATATEVLAMHLGQRPVPLLSLAPQTPPKLAQAIERSMAKNPARRHQSAAELIAAIDASVEPVREIPVPIRVWLAKRDQNTLASGVASGLLAFLIGGLLSGITHIPSLGIVTGASLCAAILLQPGLAQTRRVLKAGYALEDLRGAIRDHWRRRVEELTFERGARWERSPRAPAIVIASASAVALCATVLAQGLTLDSMIDVLKVLKIAGAVSVAGIALLGLTRWSQRSQPPARMPLRFRLWNGGWGVRLVALAGLGLRKGQQQSTLPQLTEVALGRATDALYEALPRDYKRRLSDLPATVRRLETDAKRMRDEITKLDRSIAALEGDDRIAASAQVASAHALDGRSRDHHSGLAADLTALRERANRQLAAAVAALETIRIDLLRLQVGDGRIESVTEALNAARDSSEEIRRVIDSESEVERTMRAPRAATVAKGIAPLSPVTPAAK